MPKRLKKVKYDYIKIPEDLAREVDIILGSHGYRSRAEFAKDAIRRLLRVYGVPVTEET